MMMINEMKEEKNMINSGGLSCRVDIYIII